MDGNSGDFQLVKSYLVHNTKLTEVKLQLVLIQGKPYIGLHRESQITRDGEDKLTHKSILIPLTAWNDLIRRASPGLIKEAEKILPAKTPSKVLTKSIEDITGWIRAPKKIQPAQSLKGPTRQSCHWTPSQPVKSPIANQDSVDLVPLVLPPDFPTEGFQGDVTRIVIQNPAKLIGTTCCSTLTDGM